jgi:hypothetical protein
MPPVIVPTGRREHAERLMPPDRSPGDTTGEGAAVDHEPPALVVIEPEIGPIALQNLLTYVGADAATLVRFGEPHWTLLAKAVGTGTVAVGVSSEDHAEDLTTLVRLVRRQVTVRVLLVSPDLRVFAERALLSADDGARATVEPLPPKADATLPKGSSREASPAASSPATNARVDVTVHNPVGFVRSGIDGYAVLFPAVDRHDALSSLSIIRQVVAPRQVHVLRNDVLGQHGEQCLEVLRRYRGVLDHPHLHEDTHQHALTLLSLAAAGVPTLGIDVPAAVRAALGPEVTAVMDDLQPSVLDDDDARERHSVRLRRVALRVHLTGEGTELTASCPRLPVPPVTVLVTTNRPRFLDHVLEQVQRQHYPEKQVVLGLHGGGFPAGLVPRIKERLGEHADVLEIDGAAPLGGALNSCLARAAGTLVTKMDDDDWYGDEHVWDLVLAHGYSRAEVVGKGAEFVFLANRNVTLRRFAMGAERYGTTVGGGTLCADRAWLARRGGFVATSLGEDRALLEETLLYGGWVYRTHGLGYVLHRHGEHAWTASDEYFADAAVATHSGAAFDLALI